MHAEVELRTHDSKMLSIDHSTNREGGGREKQQKL